jgi:tripartite-type tricarboxylate transporter receptor subunit TctC
MPRSLGLSVLVVLALQCTFAHTSSSAQNYPNRPVRIIVPFGAGGPGDMYTRVLAHHLSESLKQPFVVEPRPGAGSIIGSEAVAKSPPDGYTLLMVSNAHTSNETLVPGKSFNLMRDFVTISGVNHADIVMVVHPSLPANNLQEFIAVAKARPGQINYASSGPGTVYHMAGELLKTMTGIDIVHVPHKASGDMRNSVVGGHVQMMFDAISTVTPLLQGGQVRAIGTTGKQRTSALPDVPTISEAGVPGYETSIWFGLMAPAGTPKDIVDKLNAEVRKVLAHPDVKALWTRQGVTPIDVSQAEFEKFLRDDIDKWAKVVKATGFKLN